MRQRTALCMCNVIYQWATHGWVYTSVCVTWRVWHDAFVLATQRMRMRQNTVLYVCRDISTSNTWGSIHLCMCDVTWSIHMSRQTRPIPVGKETYLYETYCYRKRDLNTRGKRPISVGWDLFVWDRTYLYGKTALIIRGKRPISVRWDLLGWGTRPLCVSESAILHHKTVLQGVAVCSSVLQGVAVSPKTQSETSVNHYVIKKIKSLSKISLFKKTYAAQEWRNRIVAEDACSKM